MDEEQIKIVKDIIYNLLQKMGIESRVETEMTDDVVIFNIRTADSGILIGQHGSHLAALQHLSRVLAFHKLQASANFAVDVEGYKKSREEFLRELANQAAKRVLETNERLVLKPMEAYERRIVHAVVSEFTGVVTESTGEEPERRVVVRPA